MFNKNRKISTKNLYLLELVEVTNTEFIRIMNILKMFLLVLLMIGIIMVL